MLRKSFSTYVGLGVCALVLASYLTACSAPNNTTTDNQGAATREHTIKVGASPSPHAAILKAIAPELEKEGYKLEVVEFSDYIQPNVALTEGEIDANYFQHKPYLDDYNTKNNVDLVSAAAIHFEPMSLYAGTSHTLDNIDHAKIAVPSDPTNEARALLLLQAQGIITLKDNVGLEATTKDIVNNPHQVEIIEAEAATLPRSLEDVNFAVINGNYALSAQVDQDRRLATEDASSEAAKTYANIIAVQKDKLNDPKTKALVKALTSDAAKHYIDTTYQGTVVPVF